MAYPSSNMSEAIKTPFRHEGSIDIDAAVAAAVSITRLSGQTQILTAASAQNVDLFAPTRDDYGYRITVVSLGAGTLTLRKLDHAGSPTSIGTIPTGEAVTMWVNSSGAWENVVRQSGFSAV